MKATLLLSKKLIKRWGSWSAYDYNAYLMHAPDDKNALIHEKKFISFNAIDFTYIKDSHEINNLIDIISNDFLSGEDDDTKERKNIQKQLCKTYQVLISHAHLQKLTINWVGAAGVMIQAILDNPDNKDTKNIVNSNVGSLKLEQMIILSGLWQRADLGQSITAKEINTHLGIQVIHQTNYSPTLFTLNNKPETLELHFKESNGLTRIKK